jgi:IS30 family transposase
MRRRGSPTASLQAGKKHSFPDDEQHRLSHETIYKSLNVQTCGLLQKELLEHLRAKRTIRRSRHASLKHNGLRQLKNAISISERPASVEDRAVPGHWEGNIIAGSRNSYIATLVERQSRSWIVTPTGSPILAKPKVDRTLVKGLREAMAGDPLRFNAFSMKARAANLSRVFVT